MTKKIILASIFGAMLSGCMGENAISESSSMKSVYVTKLKMPDLTGKNWEELLANETNGEYSTFKLSVIPKVSYDDSGDAFKLFAQTLGKNRDNYLEGVAKYLYKLSPNEFKPLESIFKLSGGTLELTPENVTENLSLLGFTLHDKSRLPITSNGFSDDIGKIIISTTKEVFIGTLYSATDRYHETKLRNEINVEKGILALDTAQLFDTTIDIKKDAQLIFKEWRPDNVPGIKGGLIVQYVELMVNATITSASAITIPKTHILGLTHKTASITLNGAGAAGKFTNLGILNQTAGTITAAGGFINGQAEGTDNAINPAVPGKHTMSGGEVRGNYTNLAGQVKVSGGAQIIGNLINHNSFEIDGSFSSRPSEAEIQPSRITGNVKNAGYMTISGSANSAVVGDVENTKQIFVLGGSIGNITNKKSGEFCFGYPKGGNPSSNAQVGNLVFEKGSEIRFNTGGTLTTKQVTVEDSKQNIWIVITDKFETPLLDAGFNNILLRDAVIWVSYNTGRPIKKGTLITLAKTTGTLNFNGTVEHGIGEQDLYKLNKLGNSLTLEILKDIIKNQSTTLASKIAVGSFGKSRAGKLVGAREASFAGATFAVAGDMNVSNGFNANNAQVQMNMGSTTFTSNFTKTAGMDLTGTFAAFNTMDVAGFTLTNSVSFATKGDLKTSSFNEMGFMTGVSKNLGSNGFELTPSVSVGFAKLSDVAANIDGYSVQGASSGAYLADFSLDAGHAFKVSGIELQANAGISFGVKSSQSFELTNAQGDVMNGIISNKNVGLNVGFSAKIDEKTSFYANAKTESYNNSKKMEVGFKF